MSSTFALLVTKYPFDICFFNVVKVGDRYTEIIWIKVAKYIC